MSFAPSFERWLADVDGQPFHRNMFDCWRRRCGVARADSTWYRSTCIARMTEIVGALVRQERFYELTDQSPESFTVRLAPLRRAALSFVNAISIGLRSGE